MRIIHKASGAVGVSRTHKSQHSNKKEALKRLSASKEFKIWLTRTAYAVTSGKTIEQRVEESLISKNLKIESKTDDGKWELIPA